MGPATPEVVRMVRDRLKAAASRAKAAVQSDSSDSDGARARDAVRNRLEKVDRERVLRAARRAGEGAQIDSVDGASRSREATRTFKRAEESARAGPVVDATLNPVSQPEQVASYATGNQGQSQSADELVYATSAADRQRPDKRMGDGFARRDMLNAQTPLVDGDGSPASESMGVSLVLTDGEPDTAPKTNDIDEMVAMDGTVDDDDGDDGWGWF